MMDDVQRELTSAVVKLTEALEEILTLTEPLLGMSDDTRGFSAQDIADARAQTGVWRAQLGRQSQARSSATDGGCCCGEKSSRGADRLNVFPLRQGPITAVVCVLLLPSLIAAGRPPWRPGGGKVRLENEGDVSRLIGDGWVRTTRSYLDPRVEFDFRLVGPDSKGALIVRAYVARQGAYAKSGYRVMLANGDDLTIKPLAQRAVNSTARAASLGPDQWHHLELGAILNAVSVSVDGGPAATVEGREYQGGYVGLEVTHGTVEFRHIGIGEQATLACEPRDETPASPRKQTPDGHGEKVNLPLLTHEVRPNYTLETMSDRVGGTARLEAMVLQDGTVGRACVRRGLHPDLDVQAVAAAREWRFKPATRNSEPVPVLVTIDMAFQP